ncbi:hypothetical protein [Nocardioides convexus]|uniref:hypothetical protein n=1 Tax=Nocardioides convexus TaxID=2712224 RepID=UPI00241818FA|nr:hypothetical protein [Nocardioides convexus]
MTGHAPDALADLPRPDAVFVGGGATAPGLLEPVPRSTRAARATGGPRGDPGDRGAAGRGLPRPRRRA